MPPLAYYNEFEPYAAQWLRNLINAGLIAPGDVDERDLNDVRPDDLRPYTQVHLCAGIGVWSRALRNIGWPDDKPIWSASFPCQPFSAAGQGMGFADERHLWPTGFHLISQLRPSVIVGEQVASGLAWLDLVQTDMERADYAFGAVDTCAAGLGAPHIRQRTYWMADTGSERRDGEQIRVQPGRPQQAGSQVTGHGGSGFMGNTVGPRLERLDPGAMGHQLSPAQRDGEVQPIGLANTDSDGQRERRGPGEHSRGQPWPQPIHGGPGERLADADQGERGRIAVGQRGEPYGAQAGRQQSDGEPQSSGQNLGIYGGTRPMANGARTSSDDRLRDVAAWTGPTNGYWRDADWLFCRDGKWRPVEPGTFPLAHAWNLGNRVGMLRAAGNAINIAQAEAFLAAALT